MIPGIYSGANSCGRGCDRYPLPEDLRGKRVLDIGAASGWNSFECERRGAEVVAIDCVEYDELPAVKRLRESKIEYAIADMEELTPERFGLFDYVLFFGVFYHLRHPLLGLENVCAVTRGVAFIESYVIDDAPDPARCYMEFYETDELGGQIDNWCGPTTQCLLAMTRAAGFPRAEFLYTDSRRGGLVAHRRWEPWSRRRESTPPFLCSAVNNRHDDIVFQPRKDEYMCWLSSDDEPLTKDDVLVEIDEYGIPAASADEARCGHWQVNCEGSAGNFAGRSRCSRWDEARVVSANRCRSGCCPPGADRATGETPFVAQARQVAAPHVCARGEHDGPQHDVSRISK